jgi:hypothetical protein
LSPSILILEIPDTEKKNKRKKNTTQQYNTDKIAAISP